MGVIALPAVYESLTPVQRKMVREEYIRQQDGKCYHCKQDLDGPASETVLNKPVTRSLFPENFFKWPVHLHHSHKTGMTLGAVHCYCNAVLWEYHNE